MAERRFDQLLDMIENLNRRVVLLEKQRSSTLELLDTVFMDDARARHLNSNPATRDKIPVIASDEVPEGEIWFIDERKRYKAVWEKDEATDEATDTDADEGCSTSPEDSSE